MRHGPFGKGIVTTIDRGAESDSVARRFFGHFCQGLRIDPQEITIVA